MNLDLFEEIWLVDFEYRSNKGENPDPVCVVARELRTGRTIRMRQQELKQQKRCPFRLDSRSRLGTKIRKAREKNSLDILFKQILTSKLWLLDDWGVVSMPRDVSEEVFDLFDRRKHNSAMILTSNRDVEEWPEVFSDPVLAGAAIDRMFENANVCVFEGPSHRMKGRIIFKEIDND